MKEVWLVFWRFLALGCVSFGGPAAHIGYFQRTFVEKLQWLDAAAYARLISLSQFLPGPGSSQIGFALGLRRAGIWGGIAAFLGFTLPSFLLMVLLSQGTPGQLENPLLLGLNQGLKQLAVVVVAAACLSMYKSFCQTRLALGLALFSVAGTLIFPTTATQLLILLLAALIGSLQRPGSQRSTTEGERLQKGPLLLFGLLFLGLPLLAAWSPWLQLFNSFYHAGSLVFGGGHVVLPLLEQILGESISSDRFLLGYAAAQAVPGPMFSLAAYLGAELVLGPPLWGALLATAAIFLPGFLLVLGLQGAWENLALQPKIAGAMAGINAAVVGLLLAALYTPVFVSAVSGPQDLALVLIGFYALQKLKIPIVLLVFSFALLGMLLT